MVFPYFLFELFFKLFNAIGLRCYGILDKIGNLIGDHMSVHLEKVDLGHTLISNILTKRSDVNLLVSVQVEEHHELVVESIADHYAVPVFNDLP